MPPRRVISLVPSITETLFDLGAGDAIVGVTDFCIFPCRIEAARVGGTKNPKIDAIRALQPDLVHMNFEENLERHAREIEQFAPIHVTEPKNAGDVARLITELGKLHDRPERAAEWVAALRMALMEMPQRPFTFAVPIWKKPWMWCGGDTYVSQLIETAGGQNVLGRHKRYPTLPIEEILEAQPDVVFLPDEPYLFTDDDARELGAQTTASVIGPFAGHLVTWHGTRTLKGLEFLKTVLRRR